MEAQVVIRGRVMRYYDKQLALQAVIDLLDRDHGPRIEHSIDVVGDASRPEAGSPAETHYRECVCGGNYDAHRGGHASRVPLADIGLSLPLPVSRRLVREFRCRALGRTHADVMSVNPFDLPPLIEPI